MKNKRLILLFFILFGTIASFAQQQNQDVVYLKNGSVIRGVIIAQEEYENIKIVTANGTILTFPMKDISVINTAESLEVKKDPSNAIRRGYLGVSFGSSLPLGDNSYVLGDFADFRINFGYLFSERWGIAAVIGAQSYSDRGYYDNYVGTNSLLVGPQFTTRLSSNLEWDIRPMIGFGSVYTDDGYMYSYHYIDGLPSETGNSYNNDNNTVFAGGLGSSLRLHTSSKFSVLFNVDYSFMLAVDYLNKKQTLSSMTFGVGFAYRLK